MAAMCSDLLFLGVLTLVVVPDTALGAIPGRADAQVTLREGLAVNTFVYKLESSSVGIARRGHVEFFLLKFRKYFSLDPGNGILKTKRVIDLEDPQLCRDNTRCCPNARDQPCIFVLPASVRSESSRLLTIHVVVKDVNDNSPKFADQEVFLTFPEGHDAVGSRRSLPMAVDHDYTLENRKLRYKLAPTTNAHFMLEETPGQDGPSALYLKLTAPLNAEERLSHSLRLIATDFGGKEASLTLNVSVEDRNEFAPVFSPALAKDFSVSEREAPGYVITRVVATDADAPPNNRVHYRLLPSTPAYVKAHIVVDPDNGTVSLRQRLDFEQQKKLEFDVVAVDSGREERTANIRLSVSVRDFNDNAPKITVDRGGSAISIAENNNKFARIATILVEDKDSGPGGRVSCRVTSHLGVFSVVLIQDSVYALEARERLDREDVAQYNVTVECSDGGRVPKTSSKTLTVNVQDENDCFPSFDRSLYSFWVWENATKGTHLRSTQNGAPDRVVVTDPDITGRPSLFLEDLESRRSESSESGAFAVLPNGTLVTDRLLDAEVRQSYNFRVCTSDGQHRQCEEVIVDVKDVNDHRPRFQQNEYPLSIPENKPSHGQVAEFRVTDDDIENRGFKFRLRSPENIASKYFHLKENRLMLSQPLDREQVMHLTFYVVVEDSQSAGAHNFTAQAKVFVTVQDRNDNAPIFQVPNTTRHTFNISYHEPIGARVLRLWAVDPDNGDNGTVRYRILNTRPYRAHKLFGVDADDYLIVCSDALSAFAHETIHMTVEAADMARKPMKASQEMWIKLVDIPPFYQHRGVERRNLLILILGASALFLLLLLIAWGIHFHRTRNTRRRIMHPSRHKVNYHEEQPLGSLRRYSLDLNNELIYHSSKMYYGCDGASADIPMPGSPSDPYTKKLLSVERASTIDERMSHDSGRGCSIDQDNGSVRKLVNEPRCASILSRSRQTPPILTSVAAPMTTTMTMTTPRSSSALAKIPNFCTPPVQRRNTVDSGAPVEADTLPARMDPPLKPNVCPTTEVWSGASPNGSACGKSVKNPQRMWTHNVSTGKLGEPMAMQHRV